MRVVVWFSCGAASACAAKLAVEKYGRERTLIVYCDTSASENTDNARFLFDVENWTGIITTQIRSKLYHTIDDVFEKTRYMSGIAGARCTTELKKIPRFEFQQPDDIHIFGYRADELSRIEKFKANNPGIQQQQLHRMCQGNVTGILEQGKAIFPRDISASCKTKAEKSTVNL